MTPPVIGKRITLSNPFPIRSNAGHFATSIPNPTANRNTNFKHSCQIQPAFLSRLDENTCLCMVNFLTLTPGVFGKKKENTWRTSVLKSFQSFFFLSFSYLELSYRKVWVFLICLNWSGGVLFQSFIPCSSLRGLSRFIFSLKSVSSKTLGLKSPGGRHKVFRNLHA